MYFVSQERQEPEETEDKRQDNNPNEKSDDGFTRLATPVQDWVDVAVA